MPFDRTFTTKNNVVHLKQMRREALYSGRSKILQFIWLDCAEADVPHVDDGGAMFNIIACFQLRTEGAGFGFGLAGINERPYLEGDPAVAFHVAASNNLATLPAMRSSKS